MNWADGLGTDSMGRYLSTADEVSHVISIWDLTKASDSDQEEVTLAAEASSVCLSGHTDEVRSRHTQIWFCNANSDQTVSGPLCQVPSGS